MNIELVITVVSSGVAAVGVAAGIISQRRQKMEQMRQAREQADERTREQARQARHEAEKVRRNTFRMARELVKDDRGRLATLTIVGQDAYRWDRDIPLLTLPGWIPRRPLTIPEVSLRLSEPTGEERKAIDTARSELQRLGYWPLDNHECQLASYSRAILEYDRSTKLVDRPSYRLAEVIHESGFMPSYALAFTRSTYFDGIDTGEPLAHETAICDLQEDKDPLSGPYRAWLADPFKLRNRAAMPGINTLTIRLSRDGPHFFMHQRGRDAGHAQGGFHVAPAGEFQPQIDEPAIWAADLNILSNIIREFCEEFLGVQEADGTGSCIVDYAEDPPFSKFTEAYQRGTMRVAYLGTGLDPLSWKPEILTACIFEESEFDETFEGMVTNQIDEGTGGHLMVGRSRTISGKAGKTYTGLPFTLENISRYADSARTLPAGVACLNLARRWSQHLLT